jgi:hypothetical protein
MTQALHNFDQLDVSRKLVQDALPQLLAAVREMATKELRS